MRLIMGLVVLLATTATAEAKSKGTFLTLEGRAGGAADVAASDPGWSAGLSLGLTLRPRGSKVRFYLLSNLDGQEVYRELNQASSTARHLDLSGSIRMVIPVDPKVRLFAEVGGGARLVEQVIFQDQLDLSQQDWTPLGLVGAGVQIRPWRELSFILRSTYRFADGSENLARQLFDAPIANFDATLGLGIHF